MTQGTSRSASLEYFTSNQVNVNYIYFKIIVFYYRAFFFNSRFITLVTGTVITWLARAVIIVLYSTFTMYATLYYVFYVPVFKAYVGMWSGRTQSPLSQVC